MKRIIKKTLIFFFVLFIILVLSLSYLRYEALKRISDFIKIYGTFSSLDLSPFPPSLSVTGLTIKIPDEVGKLNVKNAKIEVTTQGLFAKRLIFRVYLDYPQFVLYQLEGGKTRKRKIPNFDIENGRIVNGSFIYKDDRGELTLNSINGSMYWKHKRLSLNIKNSSGRINGEKLKLEKDFSMKLLLRSETGRVRIRELDIKSEYGDISLRGTIHTKENYLEAEAQINANLNSFLQYKGIQLKGGLKGNLWLEKIGESMKGVADLSISPQINKKRINIIASATFDEKLNGKANLQSSYGKNNWTCNINVSDGKFYNFNLQNLPLELFDSIFRKVPSGFFLSLNGEADPNKLNSQFVIFSEEEGSIRGNINLERNNYKVNIDEIKLKEVQGDGIISLIGKDIEASGRLNNISLKEILNSNILRNFYTLQGIPRIDGNGSCELKISGTIKNPEIYADVELKNLKLSDINIGTLEGEIKGIKDKIKFEGKVLDGIFEGDIKGDLEERKIQININQMRSENLWRELRGRLTGDVRVYFRESLEAEGKISSQLIKLRELELKGLSIPFNFKNGVFASSLFFSTGLSNVNGKLEFNPKEMKYRVLIPHISIDISKLYEDLKGKFEFSLKGEGEIYGSPIDIEGRINDVAYKSGESKNFGINSKISLFKDKISVEGYAESVEKDASLNFDLDILKDWSLNGKFNGNLEGIEKLIEFPGENVKGKFIGDVNGNVRSPEIRSISNIEGKSFFIKGFAHDFKDFSGTLIQESSSLHLRNFKARIGGGEVEGYGEAKIVKWTLEDIRLNLTGKRMRLSPFERVNGLGDGKIEIRGNLDEISIEGSFTIQSLLWRKEIGEKISFSSAPSQGPPKIFKKINLDLELRADGNAWMENSWGKVEGKFSLHIKGDSLNPIILGNITGRSGELNIGDRKFKLIRAEIYFNSPFIIDPDIYVLADTFVKDYRVTFEVKGKASKPLPQLSSSPPLPPQDILTLLALGEIYQRTSYRAGTQLGSASLLSMELSEQLKERAKKLFGVDRLRVDPYLLGSSSNPVARLTVGKKVSKDLVILYSSDLSGQREYIVYLEYNISDNFSLIGMRNENGAFSIDLKFTKRLSQ